MKIFNFLCQSEDSRLNEIADKIAGDIGFHRNNGSWSAWTRKARHRGGIKEDISYSAKTVSKAMEGLLLEVETFLRRDY